MDDLIRLIPKEELHSKISCLYSELEGDFLCFDYVYKPIAEILPKEYTVIDLGCYQAAQCYFFRDFRNYIGVDIYDIYSCPSYRPPSRFYTDNTEHYVLSIEEWFDEAYRKYADMDKLYFIMSYVPQYNDNPEYLCNMVENCTFVYCNNIVTKGIYEKEIYKAIKKGMA